MPKRPVDWKDYCAGTSKRNSREARIVELAAAIYLNHQKENNKKNPPLNTMQPLKQI